MISTTAKVERKFLKTEIPFQTQIPLAQPANASRFPKILSMYVPHHFINENGTHVMEWSISCTEAELLKTAQMYYKRYKSPTK